jgi:hypothetical protein
MIIGFLLENTSVRCAEKEIFLAKHAHLSPVFDARKTLLPC